jgi:hypothetical protein
MTQETLSAYESNDEQTNGDVFETLEEGDRIQFESKRHATKKPHVVKTGYDGSDFVAIEGPGGASKMLIQSANYRDYLSVMSMGGSGKGEKVSNLRVVGE